MNLTNQNFVSIKAANLSVQSFVFETVVGNNKFLNVTILPPRSQKTVTLSNVYNIKHFSVFSDALHQAPIKTDLK